ncbi:MAG: hypothetical protein O7B26_07345 [Planctomycetota bacterium]|nr:hypothetical protein [Planctomycetota bacterium]
MNSTLTQYTENDNAVVAPRRRATATRVPTADTDGSINTSQTFQ